jgi:hypothetical protein
MIEYRMHPLPVRVAVVSSPRQKSRSPAAAFSFSGGPAASFGGRANFIGRAPGPQEGAGPKQTLGSSLPGGTQLHEAEPDIMAEDARTLAREAIRRFEKGETDFEEFFDARGARTLMLRDQEDPRFFRMETETKSHDFVVTMTGMKLGPEGRPPRDYPREVPFVPMATAVVMLMPFSRSTMVRWEDPPDPLAAFADVREQLEDTGWVQVEGPGGAGAGAKTAFQKGNITRTLVLFQGKERTDILLTEELSDVEEGEGQAQGE